MRRRAIGWGLAAALVGCAGAGTPASRPTHETTASKGHLPGAADPSADSPPPRDTATMECRHGSSTPPLPLSIPVPPLPAPARPTCTGTYDRPAIEMVRRVIHGRDACYSKCFEDGLRAGPSLGGVVVVRIIVEDGTGAVRSAEVKSRDGASSEVAACLAEETLTLQFPPPPCGDVTLEYPFRLAADPEPPAPGAPP